MSQMSTRLFNNQYFKSIGALFALATYRFSAFVEWLPYLSIFVFAAFLDGLVRDLGARPNVSKDSRLPREIVAACYPEYGAFRDALRAFDPDRLYRSEVSERLGL